MVITKHAHERFLERFPDVQVCLTERVEAAVPFGGQLGDEEFRLDTEHDVVFVLVKTEKDLVLKTVLTRDQALANLATKSDVYKAWRNHAIEPRSPLKLERIKENQNAVENELKEMAQKDVAIKYNYYCPPREEKKLLNKKMREELGYAINALDKYYWPEVFKLIYEYNAKHRRVEN